MVHYPSIFLAAFFVLGSTVSATTYSPRRFASAVTPGQRARIFFYANNTLNIIGSNGVAAAPASFDEWIIGRDFSAPPTNITNVLPASDIAAVTYTSDTFVMRAFYQTTEGDIRSVFFKSGAWGLDPAVVAEGAAYATPIGAWRDADATQEVISVQYIDSNGLLTQRILTTDSGAWGPATTITT